MKTLKTLTLLVSLVLIAVVAVAQPQRGANRPADGILTPEVSAQLNLTDAQKGRILTLRQDQLAKMQALRETFQAGDMTPNAFQERREALMTAHDEDLKAVLSADQYEKLVTIRAERQAANREGRNVGRGAGNRGAGYMRGNDNRGGYMRNSDTPGQGYMRNQDNRPGRMAPADTTRQRRNIPRN